MNLQGIIRTFLYKGNQQICGLTSIKLAFTE